MAESKFQAGDIVTLKSGGPKMTVKAIITKTLTSDGMVDIPSNRIKVQWFLDNELMTEEFLESQLEKCEVRNKIRSSIQR